MLEVCWNVSLEYSRDLLTFDGVCSYMFVLIYFINRGSKEHIHLSLAGRETQLYAYDLDISSAYDL